MSGSIPSFRITLVVSLQAAPAFAVDDSGYVEQKRKDSAIRQNQDSGKASPPPAPNADNTISGGAPKLQSPVRDIVGKVAFPLPASKLGASAE